MQLGHAIEVVHAELLPEDKAKLIKEFEREGPTAMIGDGLNDAPALATADIGISMGISGSALATETGHVILLSNDMRKIPKAIKLSRKAKRKVIQNVFLSIITKAAILALAIAGHPLVWAAVLADVGTCLLVIFNSMLLLQETHVQGGKCCKSSSATHVHKHGCSDGHRKLLSHKDHQCCSNNQVPKVCKSQKCSSQMNVSKCQARRCNSSSCFEQKCRNSGEMHNDCESGNKFHESQHCHRGRCNTATNDLEAQITHEHSCLGSQTYLSSCTEENHHVQNLIGKRVCSAKGDHHHGYHDSKHCSHSVINALAESQKSTTSRPCYSSCCGENQISNASLQKAAESISDHHHHEEVHSCLEKHDKDHATIDVMHGGNYPESETIHACVNSLEKNETEGCCGNHRKDFPKSAAMNACMSLEKRQMGGCCKSYMKECCSKHGHFGAPLGGGLSEVIID